MVNNKIQEFLNEKFGNVRAITKEDEIWFVATDIADVLGLTNISKSLEKHRDNKDKTTLTIKYSKNMTTNVLCISKYGLHKLLSITRKISLQNKIEVYMWLTEGELFDEYISSSCLESEFVNLLDMYLKTYKKQALISNIDCQNCVFGNVNYLDLFNYTKQFDVLGYKIDIFFNNCNLIVEYDERHHKLNKLTDDARMDDICFELLKNSSNKVEIINKDGTVSYIDKNEFNHKIHNEFIRVIRVKEGKEYEGIIEILAHITSYYIY